MYAKFISETKIEPAPNEMLIDGRKYIGYNSEFLETLGYKPVEFNPKPEESIYDEDGHINYADRVYECYYTENAKTIIQDWRIASE